MDDMAWEHIYYEDVHGYVDENGVSNIEEFFKIKLEGWRDVDSNLWQLRSWKIEFYQRDTRVSESGSILKWIPVHVFLYNYGLKL